VSGRVQDPEGRPLAGASVTVSSGVLLASDSEPSVRADELGRFEFSACDVGGASVSAFHLDRPVGGKLRLDLAEGDVVEVELRCGPRSREGEVPGLKGRYERAR
jgi:hypothetical protein